jgi:D-alanine-D-alanine ligase
LKNIIIIFGGESCEHDVSVITGVMALNAIDRAKYLPIPIYVAKNGKWYTGKNFNDISIFKNIRLSG